MNLEIIGVDLEVGGELYTSGLGSWILVLCLIVQDA